MCLSSITGYLCLNLHSVKIEQKKQNFEFGLGAGFVSII
jgi:hypothetical protein